MKEADKPRISRERNVLKTMNEVEKRKQFLINFAYVTLLIAAYYVFIKYAFWMFFPFFIALFIAVLLQKPINRMVKRTKLSQRAASAICVFFVLCLIAAIVSLIGARIAKEVKGLFEYLKALNFNDLMNNAEDLILKAVGILPRSLEDSAAQSVTEWFDRLLAKDGSGFADAGLKSFGLDFSMLSTPLTGVWNTAKLIPTVLIAVVITIVSCFFMSADYDRIIKFAKRQLPEDKKRSLSFLKKIVLTSMKKLGKAYLILMAITFVEMLIGLNLFKLIGIFESNYTVAIALITAVVDIFPFLGTGTILWPWSVYSFIMGATGLGIALLVLYAVITVLRQALEPKLVASRLGLPPIVTITGIYVGIRLFGFIGIFVLPLTLVLLKILNDEGLIKLWKNKPPAVQKKKRSKQGEEKPGGSAEGAG